MKNSKHVSGLKKILLGACLAAALSAAPAQAKYQDPIYEMRRTLFIPFGQSMTVLEAPLGMCFLDESQYLEGQLIKQLRAQNKSSGGGILLAVFADCLEVGKLQKLASSEDQGPSYNGEDPNSAMLMHQGTISWLTPKEPRTKATLAEYLDKQQPAYRDSIHDNMVKSYKLFGKKADVKLDDKITARSLQADPSAYHFDERAHRTDSLVSVGYSTNVEMEYTKYATVGVVGTTLIRQFPIQVSIASTAKDKADRSVGQMTDLLDKFAAQNVALNDVH